MFPAEVLITKQENTTDKTQVTIEQLKRQKLAAKNYIKNGKKFLKSSQKIQEKRLTCYRNTNQSQLADHSKNSELTFINKFFAL